VDSSSQLRCRCRRRRVAGAWGVWFATRDGAAARPVDMFGYGSDIERTDVLYTSVLVQMSHGLVVAVVPTAPARGRGCCGSPPR
jgi:hypothetical protein